MRLLSFEKVAGAVSEVCIRAAHELPRDVADALRNAREEEESPLGRDVLDKIIENMEVAKSEMRPLCQDTGLAIFFVEKGEDVRIENGSLADAINEGVRRGYKEGCLRSSVVRGPLDRANTGDNCPAIIHLEEVAGDRLTIRFMAKGGGCENMSRIGMLTPADGEEGVKRFVVDAVERARGNPCPPIILGVGLGGTFEKAALLSKKALLRELGTANDDPKLGALEKELLKRINSLGIGPQGLGGRITALGVHVISHPCHIASLPVAVNIECHSHRHAKVIL
jgi:fumarate hydratase subunit alpha